jgi:hypothetical protein
VRHLSNRSVGGIQSSAGRSLSCLGSCSWSPLWAMQLSDWLPPR